MGGKERRVKGGKHGYIGKGVSVEGGGGRGTRENGGLFHQHLNYIIKF